MCFALRREHGASAEPLQDGGSSAAILDPQLPRHGEVCVEPGAAGAAVWRT